MSTFSVSARGAGSVQVAAPNWIAALGLGMEQIGANAAIERLACERLPNGTVIVRDIQSGAGFVVTPVDPVEEEIQIVPIDDVEDELHLDVLEGAMSPGDACEVALQLAQDLTPAESGAVLVLERGMLRFAAVSGPESGKLAGVRLPRGTGVAGYVVDQRRSVVLGQAGRDARHCGEVDALTGYRTEDLIAVPVIHGRRIYGVLELMNLPREQDFSSHVLDQMEAIGSALGDRLHELDD
ncbi:MAG: GAF domain-containing protein [Proteobacteria bacterium]|nr:GAF domain-containing protein [Pseudomonadota bacterium]